MKPKWLFDLLYLIVRGLVLCSLMLVTLGFLLVAFVRFFGITMAERTILDARAGWLDLGAGILFGSGAYAVSRTSDTRPIADKTNRL